MAKRRHPFRTTRERDREKEGEEKEGWKSWVRDIAIAVLIMVVILAGIYAYTRVWPPLVVVESASMQHSDTTSSIGVIDTGDLVFVQAAPTRADVVTYLEGRANGYATYGDYGDVIIFNLFYQPGETPIIHRAMMYAIPNGTGYADVPDLTLLPPQDWGGRNAAGATTHVPDRLESVWIKNMGFNHNLNITFTFADIYQFNARGPGYITMGDNNAPNYDKGWFPVQSDIIGHARGEIPWFGLIKLVLSPAGRCAPQGWGDPCAPQNSWTDLALALAALVALPFLVEAVGWAWGKYAWPRIRPLLPWKKKDGKGKAKPLPDELEDEDASEEPSEPGEPDEPKEGSSGP